MGLAWNICAPLGTVYIFFNPVFQVSTAKNEINLFNNHILIVAPVTFAPAGAMTPSTEFLLHFLFCLSTLCHVSGGAKVSCILRHRGVQLILAYSWARPAILVAGKGRWGIFLFLLFLHFHSCSFLPCPSL